MNSTRVATGSDASVGGERLRGHATVLYEDFSTGLRARQTFEEVARQAGCELDFELALWRFDLLLEPKLFKQAAHEAEAAEVVLLSGHGRREWPDAVKRWLLKWLATRGSEPSALAVSLDSNARDIPATVEALNVLRDAVGLHGVDVFLHLGETPSMPQEFSFKEIQRRAETTMSLVSESERRFGDQSYQHWGLNE